MIELECVRWKNFLSTGNKFIEIPLNKYSSVLIRGQNGSGKSTMLDALCFGLFNKPFRKINKPQLVNTISEKQCVVEVEFSANSKSYKIVRGIKPNIFEIYVDDVLLDQNAQNKDYQEILETQILRMSYKTFVQSVTLGNANFQAFMELPSAQRRTFVENVLGLETIGTMNTLLKEMITDKKRLVDKISRNIETYEMAIDITNEEKKRYERRNVNDIIEYKNELKDLEGEINGESVYLNETIKSKKVYEAELSNMHEKEERIGKAKRALKLMEKRDQELEEKLEYAFSLEECPECGSDQIEEYQEKIEEEVEKERKNNQDRIEKLNKIINDVSFMEELNDVKRALNESNGWIKKHEENITRCEAKIKVLEDHIKERESYEFDEKEAGLEEKKELLEKAKSDHLEESKQLNHLHIANTLLKDDGIKSKIIKEYVPIINKLINKFLDDMEFFCQFEIDENFNEVIRSRYRDKFSYNSFSEGEKMRIDLALLFTWREIARMRNTASCNLLIMDEIMDSSMDDDGVQDFLNILNKLASKHNMFIISHKENFYDEMFDHAYSFIKKDNFSRLAYG